MCFLNFAGAAGPHQWMISLKLTGWKKGMNIIKRISLNFHIGDLRSGHFSDIPITGCPRIDVTPLSPSPYENRNSVGRNIFTHPSLSPSDAINKRASMQAFRLSGGKELIPIHLFGCQSQGAIGGFHGIFQSAFLDNCPLIFYQWQVRAIAPSLAFPPVCLEVETAPFSGLGSWISQGVTLLQNYPGHLCKNFDFAERPFRLPVRHRRWSYLVEHPFK